MCARRSQGKTMKYPIYVVLILLMIAAAACQSTGDETVEIPTEFVLPTATATFTATVTPSVTPTATITHTPTDTPTPTDTATPTDTPTETATPTITVNPTLVAISSATAAAQEAPKYITFTPPPAGSTPVPGTPQRIADVVITERQFQEEVDGKTANMPSVSRAVVDFTPEGILISLTAMDDDGAFTTGDLLIRVNVADGIAAFQGELLMPENAPEPSESFILFATNDFFLAMVEALDGILGQRLGDTHNLETLDVTNDTIDIMLLVPDE
jgi:hypothetical protein